MTRQLLTTLTTGIFLLHADCSFGQSKTNPESGTMKLPNQAAPVKQSSITFHLEKVAGLGPDGLSSYGIATKAAIREQQPEEYKAYPETKNKPANLSDVIEYFYILDNPQFYYQNYVAHVYTKEFLIEKLAQLKFKLTDTLQLSRQPVKCYISALGGINANKERVYMVDANNNGDFSDDVARPLLKNVLDENVMLNASVQVDITYANHGEIKNEKKLVFIAQSNDPHHSGMGFTFPEFRYCRFLYKGKPYLLTTGSNTSEPYITVLPDRPYFASIGWDKRVKKDQVVQIGEEQLVVSNITDNTKQITLTGNDISGFATGLNNKGASPKMAVKKTPALTLRQTGFIAPPVKGVNINPNAEPGAIIATANLRGKYVFIDFWSTYCSPCIQEFDYLKEAYAKYNRQQLEIVGVIDDRDQNITLQILKDHRITWPNIKMEANGTSIPGYQDINSYPTNLLIDPQGKIIAMDLRGDALMNKLKTLIAL